MVEKRLEVGICKPNLGEVHLPGEDSGGKPRSHARGCMMGTFHYKNPSVWKITVFQIKVANFQQWFFPTQK
ncbi:hypothetical protein SLEP1_g32068 [Rubroshorea leprosula]|uniref:Uncharacterized protein n=1 Tax=Rubroshorea leprosula TaxID=152421 RepID=A0AAV5KC73_9ROSI|nr:hypothetical protein SLEP1_g32068 [Rubroshorea leprosula]